jgi:hypothetical protein
LKTGCIALAREFSLQRDGASTHESLTDHDFASHPSSSDMILAGVHGAHRSITGERHQRIIAGHATATQRPPGPPIDPAKAAYL